MKGETKKTFHTLKWCPGGVQCRCTKLVSYQEGVCVGGGVCSVEILLQNVLDA